LAFTDTYSDRVPDRLIERKPAVADRFVFARTLIDKFGWPTAAQVARAR